MVGWKATADCSSEVIMVSLASFFCTKFRRSVPAGIRLPSKAARAWAQTYWARESPRCSTPRMVSLLKLEINSVDVARTTIKTRKEMSAVSLVLRLIFIFLQLVVKGLQTDAQQLCRPCLIIVGEAQGFKDQATLGLVHCHARVQPRGFRRLALVAESRRKVFQAKHLP